MLCSRFLFCFNNAIYDIINELLDKIAKKRRCLSHKLYVKSVMADIQNNIAKEAITTGKVDLSKRKLFLKYKNYYEKL